MDRDNKKYMIRNDVSASKYFIWIAKGYWKKAQLWYWTQWIYDKYASSVLLRLQRVLSWLTKLW